MKVPTRITSGSSATIDHILASYSERVTRHGVVDIGFSDHQLIYCTKKISRIREDFTKK